MLTIPEYETLQEAQRLKEFDKNHFVHWLAFNIFRVKATRKSGKNKSRPVYSRFDKFFNYDKELKKAKSKVKQKERFAGVGKVMRKGGGEDG